MSAPAAAPGYHERQRLQRCALHALNNLFQRPECDVRELDGIAGDLAPGRLPLPWLNPHRTLLGNYDVNTVEVALRRRGKELRWHDVRDASFARLDLQAPGLQGLILNVQAESALGRWTGGRHWLALRRCSGRWWNLDSKLPAPRLVAACCEEAAAVADAAAAADAGAAAAAATAAEGAAHAAEQDAAAGAAAVAADEAAVRRFLQQELERRDAKVFLVADCPLASHPLVEAGPAEAAAAEVAEAGAAADTAAAAAAAAPPDSV